jgi:hypothetical protein
VLGVVAPKIIGKLSRTEARFANDCATNVSDEEEVPAERAGSTEPGIDYSIKRRNAHQTISVALVL